MRSNREVRLTPATAAESLLDSPTMPDVYWTITAKRRLRTSLAEELCREHGSAPDQPPCPGIFAERRHEIDALLKVTFNQAVVIVVRNQMTGYRRKQGVWTLLLDVFGGARPGAYVVKIGPDAQMQAELKAWQCCYPEDLREDLVFLPLEDGEVINGLRSLRYGDAHQFLGVERIITFDEAALGAICFDFPSCASVGIVLWELYERIAHLLYGQSFEDGPPPDAAQTPAAAGRPPAFRLDVKNLKEAMEEWKQGLLSALRSLANAAAPHGPGEFLDPVYYLSYVRRFVAFAGDAPSGGTPSAAAASTPVTPPPPGAAVARWAARPSPADVVPRMLRGCAHGDLHGRNILLAQIRGKALWPTIFDYEDMGPGNLLGWDFVKLETELKIRAYVALDHFDGSERLFVERVQKFEKELAAGTEARYRGNEPWGIVKGDPEPLERLRQVLLEIRHRAAVHLGHDRGRPTAWLEEYYFQLLCYGVCTGRFANQSRREHLAAFVSAGVAAARLSWPNRF